MLQLRVSEQLVQRWQAHDEALKVQHIAPSIFELRLRC